MAVNQGGTGGHAPPAPRTSVYDAQVLALTAMGHPRGFFFRGDTPALNYLQSVGGGRMPRFGTPERAQRIARVGQYVDEVRQTLGARANYIGDLFSVYVLAAATSFSKHHGRPLSVLLAQWAFACAWTESGGYGLVGWSGGTNAPNRKEHDTDLGMSQVISLRYEGSTFNKATGLSHSCLAVPWLSALYTVNDWGRFMLGWKAPTLDNLANHWPGGAKGFPGHLLAGAKVLGDAPLITGSEWSSSAQIRKITALFFPAALARIKHVTYDRSSLISTHVPSGYEAAMPSLVALMDEYQSRLPKGTWR